MRTKTPLVIETNIENCLELQDRILESLNIKALLDFAREDRDTTGNGALTVAMEDRLAGSIDGNC